ncbi:hypothetical protein AGABI1DRAFT_125473 [Agaricus bisporus var. burnettii JB137-S8]|uniref:RecA family profile 1 domain-containing protein n=1 Tax=Agaricus bisporus var. burnettii (strain JB137-S8 / ATCC MYA-4627 / FGSC 10392) TaxID=597362 RepID=K5Y4M2_AGABU|nr:uncharacterized protein AGABI1DRAFT_125473 [Agaricus bisporus var. burnettii JB137-S8]EKM82995.1 hypothetical protein AGABI1DRAFT_125473 [Agaricus bisporus var. burnettii JB137-S8]
MDKILVATLPHLTDSQKAILRRGNVASVADLVLIPPQELSKRCRTQPSEISQLIRDVCCNRDSLAFQFQTLEDPNNGGTEHLSLGDPVLDDTLSGGLRTGMIWEIVGESAAGKTQFALQLSLHVQLHSSQGGLGGAACYLTTSTKLQTSRLLQIKQMRNLSDASLEDVHTISTPTVHVLLNVLDKQLPTFIETISQTVARKPVKLVVIDALAELFHVANKVTTASLVERSQQLTRISALLHQLVQRHNIVTVVLNEVLDAFDYNTPDSGKNENGLLVYSEQAKWFNRGYGVYGEDRKEASLGLVWANQVNARVMLSRTGRRRYIEEEAEGEGDKRQKVQNEETSRSKNATSDGEPLLIRRMTVIFNSAGSRKSCDYIVTASGVKGLADEGMPIQPHMLGSDAHSVQVGNNGDSSTIPPVPLHQSQNPSQTVIPSSQEGEEFDQLWEEGFYENVDWDDLEKTLSQASPKGNRKSNE